MSDYSRADIKAALDKLPLERGDVVFCHSNLGFFGRCEGVASSNDLCEVFFNSIMERLGPNGALCVPTFTYSFQNGGAFDPAETPAPKMGMLAEWVRRHKGARSHDPCYSVAAWGAGEYQLVAGVAENSFDSLASFFARFWRAGGKVLNLNFDAGSTFIIHAERQLGVPYRFDKTFRGVVKLGVVEREAKSTIWVHYLDDALVADYVAFDRLAREKGVFRTAKLGRGEMGVISAEDTYKLIEETLPSRPWFLTRAEVMGVEPDPLKFSALR